MGGKPHVAGRRISVQDIAVWHELLGKSADEIAEEYELELAQIYAALAYFFDHRAEIEGVMRREEGFVEKLRESVKSKLSA